VGGVGTLFGIGQPKGTSQPPWSKCHPRGQLGVLGGARGFWVVTKCAKGFWGVARGARGCCCIARGVAGFRRMLAGVVGFWGTIIGEAWRWYFTKHKKVNENKQTKICHHYFHMLQT
jgi:hypothetical protein